jgi:hypothetical protein
MQNGYSLWGATIDFDEPSGAACMAGGVSPCGLAAGAPPLPVERGPVWPCGCLTPFVPGDIVVPVLLESAVCARAKLAPESKQIVTMAMWAAAVERIQGNVQARRSVPKRSRR